MSVGEKRRWLYFNPLNFSKLTHQQLDKAVSITWILALMIWGVVFYFDIEWSNDYFVLGRLASDHVHQRFGGGGDCYSSLDYERFLFLMTLAVFIGVILFVTMYCFAFFNKSFYENFSIYIYRSLDKLDINLSISIVRMFEYILLSMFFIVFVCLYFFLGVGCSVWIYKASIFYKVASLFALYGLSGSTIGMLCYLLRKSLEPKIKRDR